jgi:hypothetical protein
MEGPRVGSSTRSKVGGTEHNSSRRPLSDAHVAVGGRFVLSFRFSEVSVIMTISRKNISIGALCTTLLIMINRSPLS